MSLPNGLDAAVPDFTPDSGAALSENIYSSPDMRMALAEIPARETGGVNDGMLNITSVGDSELESYPMLDPTLAEQIKSADKLTFSAPSDNTEKTADYKLVVGEDGKLELLNLCGEGCDPLDDGELNIEIDPGDMELAEAIKAADQSLKEFVREMMHYFTINNPGKTPPHWWNDVLSSEPDIPEQAQPVPIRQATNPFDTLPRSPYGQPPEQEETDNNVVPDIPEGNEYTTSPGTGSPSGRSPGGNSPGSNYRPGADYSPSGDYARDSVSPNGTDFSTNTVPDFEDNTDFFGRLKGMLYGHESGGNPEALNEWDVNGISVGLRQWHAGGELPELLNAWQTADPQKFNQYFEGRSPEQIDQLGRSKEGVQEILPGMKQALADPEYQKVQNELVDDFLKRTVKRGMDGGLSTERELAEYVDLYNQSPQWAQEALKLGAAPGDQSHEMEMATRGGKYDRYAAIQNNFSTGEAQLVAKTPEPTDVALRLADAAKVQDANMAGTGKCAAAIQRALKDVGLGQFVGSGDAWDMYGPLKRSGLFQEVPMSQAAVGDIILRPPSADPRDDSVHGDISVVTARNGSRITQTNDATYTFNPNNSRYDGKAVFLRYVGPDTGTRYA